MNAIPDHRIVFANLTFKGLTKKVLLREERSLKIIVPVGAELIVLANTDLRFREIINNNYASFDGQIPYLFARMRNTITRFEKISGSDFIFDVCRYAAENNKRVFLLGGYQGSNEQAVSILRNKYRLSIDGYSPVFKSYPFDEKHNETIVSRLSVFKPDILLVAFGAPKQEFWIDDHKKYLDEIGVRWAICVGGSFEFISGSERRAPRFIQSIGFEGLWRLFQNSKRFKRFLAAFKFIKYI